MRCINIHHFLLSVALFAHLVTCNSVFEIRDTYIGKSFLDGFDYITLTDPTHGRVNYVSRETAIQNNLSYVSNEKFVMRADSTNKVSPDAPGRDSIRIQSHVFYADSLVVLELSHMPEGCSTWPAFWTISAKGPWPQGGEIDVIEGVNKDQKNLASQHTTPGCTMADQRPMTGQSVSTNCDAQVNYNQGCGVRFSKLNSYGESFNSARGGWYAMRRTVEDGVSIWFWSRHDDTVPRALRNCEPTLKPDESWGEPEAFFPPTTCSPNHLDAHQLIFDLTFCGDWAGSAYEGSGCPGSCTDFVNNHPEAFAKAFWEVDSLRVYTPS